MTDDDTDDLPGAERGSAPIEDAPAEGNRAPEADNPPPAPT